MGVPQRAHTVLGARDLQGSGGASAQFRSSHATEGGRFAWIRNLNTNKTEYQYQIRVYKRGTNTFIQSPDPAILNDN